MVIDFINFANGLGSGYLKHSKAVSMLVTFTNLKSLRTDSVRRENWVRNCLVMEGFSGEHCALISEFMGNMK